MEIIGHIYKFHKPLKLYLQCNNSGCELKNHPAVLEKFLVNAKDRKYQIWERNPLSLDLLTKEIFIQKMNYIHYNPVEAGLSVHPEQYKYSSAGFYETGINEFGFITHWMG